VEVATFPAVIRIFRLPGADQSMKSANPGLTSARVTSTGPSDCSIYLVEPDWISISLFHTTRWYGPKTVRS
jgi:hypothetical protein